MTESRTNINQDEEGCIGGFGTAFFVCGGESYSNVPEANSHTISFGTDELSLLSN
jgi:hypothetical protein